jgi:hypothetical protein
LGCITKGRSNWVRMGKEGRAGPARVSGEAKERRARDEADEDEEAESGVRCALPRPAPPSR